MAFTIFQFWILYEIVNLNYSTNGVSTTAPLRWKVSHDARQKYRLDLVLHSASLKYNEEYQHGHGYMHDDTWYGTTDIRCAIIKVICDMGKHFLFLFPNIHMCLLL